jgi:hypothetical protein
LWKGVHIILSLAMARPTAPDLMAGWMAPFAALFTRPTWSNLLVLVEGVILAPGQRTVTAALTSMGLREAANFANYHRVLNRGRWFGQALARTLLELLVCAFVPDGPVVIGIDETIERRWGARIKARGIYRDPVRSSHGHFVKASGLRWVSLMLLTPVPFAGRVWALPFLTALAPSERYAREQGRRHKLLTDWARQLLMLVARWLPGRQVIAVADTSYAAIELLAALRPHLTLITRLRLDARLFDPPPPRQAGTKGRPRVSGARQPTLIQRLADQKTPWRRVTVTDWYAGGERQLDITSGTALWYHPGKRVPIRWVLVRDPDGGLAPQAFVGTDLDADPARHSAPLRAPLVGGGDLRRGAPALGRRDAAPMVRPGHRPHHAVPARLVLARDAVGRTPCGRGFVTYHARARGTHCCIASTNVNAWVCRRLLL